MGTENPQAEQGLPIPLPGLLLPGCCHFAPERAALALVSASRADRPDKVRFHWRHPGHLRGQPLQAVLRGWVHPDAGSVASERSHPLPLWAIRLPSAEESSWPQEGDSATCLGCRHGGAPRTRPGGPQSQCVDQAAAGVPSRKCQGRRQVTLGDWASRRLFIASCSAHVWT